MIRSGANRRILALNFVVALEDFQNCRRVKRLIFPGQGIGGFWTARQTPASYEAIAIIRTRTGSEH
jgi:hypothetical protein